MQKLVLIIFITLSLPLFSQSPDLSKIAADITEEGKLLYRLENAAWNGSDIFRKSYKYPQRIGGYFTYLEDDKPKCLFFSKGEDPKVIGVVSFGDIVVVETATINFRERDFDNRERDLYEIRKKTFEEVQTDSLFKKYNNTNLNLIPLVYKGEKKVYALTAPKVVGVMLLGNDYLLKFDNQNNLISKQELHSTLIPIRFDGEEENAVASMHSHAAQTGDFITATDVCTLMLYGKYTQWKRHYVISDKYVNIWDVEKAALTIVTKEEFDNPPK